MSIVQVQILCMHGGLSPELKSMEQIKRIPRPTDVPDTGLLCDLLWADPDKEINGWGENDRGVSYTFGQDSVAEFLAKHDLDLVCRAHQVSSVPSGAFILNYPPLPVMPEGSPGLLIQVAPKASRGRSCYDLTYTLVCQ